MKENNKRFLDSLRIPAYIILVLWCIHILKVLLDIQLFHWGIYPQVVIGMRGILTAPLIHGDWAHLLSNSIPLFVLTFIIFFFYRQIAVPVIGLIYVLTGLAVWFFGNPGVYHIGASGVVYGMVAFVFWSGVFRRSAKAIILALIVTLLYSGMFYGLVPQEGISTESHWMGAILGIVTAYLFKGAIERRDEVEEYSYLEEAEESDFYLPRDTFERTREERRRDQSGFWHSDTTGDA